MLYKFKKSAFSPPINVKKRNHKLSELAVALNVCSKSRRVLGHTRRSKFRNITQPLLLQQGLQLLQQLQELQQ